MDRWDRWGQGQGQGHLVGFLYTTLLLYTSSLTACTHLTWRSLVLCWNWLAVACGWQGWEVAVGGLPGSLPHCTRMVWPEAGLAGWLVGGSGWRPDVPGHGMAHIVAGLVASIPLTGWGSWQHGVGLHPLPLPSTRMPAAFPPFLGMGMNYLPWQHACSSCTSPKWRHGPGQGLGCLPFFPGQAVHLSLLWVTLPGSMLAWRGDGPPPPPWEPWPG